MLYDLLHAPLKPLFMKTGIFCLLLFSSFSGIAQLHSGTPVIQSKPQPVPNSTTSEKSAPPQPINIPPAPNPVPPIYPGAEAKAVEIPRQIINPPVTPSGTQPIQKEPLSPVESTNTLQPNRPPRDRASRENNKKVVAQPSAYNIAVNSGTTVNTNKAIVTSSKNIAIKPARKTGTVKTVPSKKVIPKKKPRYK